MSAASQSIACAAAIVSLLIGGCQSPPATPIGDEFKQSLALLMPREIRIVEPFTTWTDSDPKPGIDGITVYVQPLSASGDPIQATGTMLVELYAFRPASGDRKGDRRELWELNLLTQADQDARWNRATQMYEFRLELSPQWHSALRGDKFILMVTHNSPLGEHRSDELVLEMPLGRSVLTQRR